MLFSNILTRSLRQPEFLCSLWSNVRYSNSRRFFEISFESLYTSGNWSLKVVLYFVLSRMINASKASEYPLYWLVIKWNRGFTRHLLYQDWTERAWNKIYSLTRLKRIRDELNNALTFRNPFRVFIWHII